MRGLRPISGQVKKREEMPTNLPIKNTNQMHTIKVTTEIGTVDPKTKLKTWKANTPTYVKPGDRADVWVGENNRVTVQEMPT